MDIIKISMVSIVVVFIALLLKQYKPEFSTFLVLSMSLFVLILVVSYLNQFMKLFEYFKNLLAGYGTYLEIIMKVIGITYICDFTSTLCKDVGYGTLASQIELCGKLTILLMGAPIIMALLDNVSNFF